jgi:uncharacterized membrane protein YgcG
MERGSKIVISIIVVAVISALVIAYYQSTSTKVVGAQCDKTKKICQVQSETTHFGYFPVYSYYYVPFPLFGPGLGMLYPGSFIRPNVCDDCLTTVTPQDEQQVLNSKTPVSQSDLPSEQPSSAPSSSGNNPGPSESGNPGEQSPSTSESPPASSPGSSPSSPSEPSPSEGSGGSSSGAESSGGGSAGSGGGGGDFGGGGGGVGGSEE